VKIQNDGRPPDTAEMLEAIEQRSAGTSRALLSYSYSSQLKNTCPIDATLEVYYRLFSQLTEDSRNDLIGSLENLATTSQSTSSARLEILPVSEIFSHFSRRFQLSMDTTQKEKPALNKLIKELKAGQKNLREVVCSTWQLWEPTKPGYMTHLSNKILAVVQDAAFQVSKSKF
jgi:hypothetical protein